MSFRSSCWRGPSAFLAGHAGRLAAGLCLVLGATGRLSAATPDWVREAMRADVSRWEGLGDNVVLLESQDVTFLSRDRVRVRYRNATRLMSDEGLGTGARFTYNANTTRIRDLRAWVVAPDGKVTVDYARGEFADTIARYGEFFWDAEHVVSRPAGVQTAVGGVFAWEYEFETEAGIFDTSWAFASGVPVVRSVFQVAPLAGAQLAWHATSAAVPAPVAAAPAGALLWEMRAIDPPPPEPPSGFLANPLRVSVRCVAAGSSAERIGTWAGLGALVHGITGPQVAVDDSIRTKARALVAGRDSHWDRVRALTDFVQREVTYLSVMLGRDNLAGYRPHPAPESLANRFGDCKDKATLLVALLQAIEQPGFMVLVYSGNATAVPADWPSACFNHAIVAIPATAGTPADWPVAETAAFGRVVLFDPTDPLSPLGVLSRGDQHGFGLLVAAEGSELIQLVGESPERRVEERTVQATLDARGDLHADVREGYVASLGVQEYGQRDIHGAEEFERNLEGELHRQHTFLRELQWSDAWDPAPARYELKFTFRSEGFARALGRDRWYFNPAIRVREDLFRPWNASAEGAVSFVARGVRDTVRLQLPEGFAVDEIPRDWTREIDIAVGRLTYVVEGRELVFRREMSRRHAFLDRTGYENLRAFLREMQVAERRPVFLRRVAGAAPPP